MTTSTKNQRTAGKTATSGGASAKEPKSYPDTAEGRMEAAADGVRVSLARYERGLADMLDCDTSLVALKKEVDDYLASIDPRDEKAVSVVSIKRDQIHLLPIYREKEEVKQDERGAAFIQELEGAAKAILACADVEIGRALDVVEAAIRPWFPPYIAPADQLNGLPQRTVDPARQMASSSALFSCGLHTPLAGALNWQPPQGGRLHGNAASERNYDRTLIERAKQLLGIYQAWQENGRKFLRHAIPPAPSKPETAQEAAQPVSAVPEQATPESVS